jgi:hypothetical protein
MDRTGAAAIAVVTKDEANLELDSASPGANGDRAAMFGAGVGVTIAERLNLRAEYEVVEIDGLDDPNAIWVTAA